MHYLKLRKVKPGILVENFLVSQSCCPQLHVGMQREYLLIKTIDTRAAP
ncbi:hypothetical protein BH18THE2_BH18THE2_30680 [soil metagenome]